MQFMIQINKMVMVIIFEQQGGDGRAVVYSSTSQETQLTLADTTVSKASDESLVEGSAIDQVLTVGERIQHDVQANIGWITSVGTSGDEGSNDIEVDNSGNVNVVGRTASYSKGFVLQLSSSGNIRWNREMGGSNTEQYHAVATDSSGNVYAVGKTMLGQGGYDWLIAKYSPTGSIEWKTTLGTSSPNGEQAWGVDIDDSGNVYVSGAYIISGTAQSGWAVANLTHREIFSGKNIYTLDLVTME